MEKGKDIPIKRAWRRVRVYQDRERGEGQGLVWRLRPRECRRNMSVAAVNTNREVHSLCPPRISEQSLSNKFGGSVQLEQRVP